MRQLATVLLSAIMMGLGFALILRTAQLGSGGGLGYLLGSLFVLAGAARLYLTTRSN